MKQISSNYGVYTCEGISFYITFKKVKRLSMRPSDDGTSILVASPSYVSNEIIKKFISSNIEWAKKAISKSIDDRDGKYRVPNDEEINVFVLEFKRKLDKISREMNLYHRIRKVNFRFMKSRWGSCNYVSGSLSFNLYLINFPEECTEYVIIHELSHFLHPNHSREFWNHVERYCPQWRRLRRSLR